MIHNPIVLDSGKLKSLDYQNKVDYIEEYHSGRSLISTGETVIIRDNKQMINFTQLTLDGDLCLEGDLWQA